MKPAVELSPDMRATLDELPVSQLAEYICQRVGLNEGQTMLQLKFVAGRYERMQRFAVMVGDNLRPASRSGRSGVG